MRELSNGATSDWAAFQEQKRLVTYNEDTCINKTRVCFEEESFEVYEELDSCLAGETDVPTPTPSTPSTTVKVSSTSSHSTTKPTPTRTTTTKSIPTGSPKTTSTTKSSNENTDEEDN